MFQLVEDRSQKGKEMRMCVVNTLQEQMDQDKKVVALEADLGGASGFIKIKDSHPFSVESVKLIWLVLQQECQCLDLNHLSILFLLS